MKNQNIPGNLLRCIVQIALLSLLLACTEGYRQIDIPVRNDIGKVKWRIETPGLSDGRYSLVVSLQGRERVYPMWEDWGPAQRADFYVNKDYTRLLVLGAGANIMIDMRLNEKVSIAINSDMSYARKWCLLGKVDGPFPVHFEENKSPDLCNSSRKDPL